jgi:hypothetical protein
VVALRGVTSASEGYSLPALVYSKNIFNNRSVGVDRDIFRSYNYGMATIKRGRGRPRKGSAATKSEGVLLRMEKREKEGFAAAAELAGAPLSVWMRERLRRAAKKELEEAGREVAFLG